MHWRLDLRKPKLRHLSFCINRIYVQSYSISTTFQYTWSNKNGIPDHYRTGNVPEDEDLVLFVSIELLGYSASRWSLSCVIDITYKITESLILNTHTTIHACFVY